MSILGYSTAYFLPQYWVNTPLYGEKILPLLDYILSTDYEKTELLASAFYNIESKYKNTADLPIECIEEIINESGYTYIRNLLGQDSDSLRVLVYLLVLIHELKGSKKGIEVVMELLRSPEDSLTISYVGEPTISAANEVSNFTVNDYVIYSNFSAVDKFSINFQIRTGSIFQREQCIASAMNYGFYLGIDEGGHLVLKVGQQSSGQRAWQEIDGTTTFVSAKVLRPSTNYYIILAYDGNEYSLKVSTDGEKYSYYLTVASSTPLNIVGGYIYIGVDRSTSKIQYPFDGEISLAPFTISSENVILTQWFETYPMGEENTFELESELDVGLVSATFFKQFAKFVEKYVYPTLIAFKAKLTMKGKITFLPYTRQKVTYVASNIRDTVQNFMVEENNNNENYISYEVEDGQGNYEDYYVQRSSGNESDRS